MVLVNGMPYVGALDDPKEFAQFVLTSASDAYYKTPTATPSPSVDAVAGDHPVELVRADAAGSVGARPFGRLGHLPTWRNW